MVRRFSVNFALFAILADLLAVTISVLLGNALRPALNALPGIATIPAAVALPATLLVIFPLGWVVILGSLSLYDGKRYIRAVDEFAALSLGSVLAAVALAGTLYFSFRDFSRAQYVLFVVVSFALMFAWRIPARLLLRLRRKSHGSEERRVIVVGTGPIAQMVDDRIRAQPDAGLALLGFVDDAPPDTFSGTLVGAMSDLPALVLSRGATDVIIALPPHFYDRIRAAASCLTEVPVRLWVALGFFDLALYRTATEDFAGLPLLDLRASALDDYERGVKRGFDLLFASLALVLTSPLLVVAAVSILVLDGWPLVYSQERVGEYGRPFRIHKFRTMVVGADRMRSEIEARDGEGRLIHKTRGDPRITRLGRVLRRFSIDELPQLVNVLAGEMSLVGPRPELPDLVQEYEPWQRQRFAVPPGITGWWQVTGRSDKLMHLHTEDDLYYVRHYSIWLDLQIIMRTVWVVLAGRGAF